MVKFLVFVSVTISLLSGRDACAAEAALFNNGNRAILRNWSGPDQLLLDVDLRTGATKPVDLRSLGLPDGFQPQGCSKSDYVLGTTGSLLLACDMAKKKTVTIYTAPKGVALVDLAYNPKDGGILLRCEREETAEDENKPVDDTPRYPLIYVPTDTSKAGFVFCRRVSSVDGFSFAPDGSLYFSTQGDVWDGSIEVESEVIAGRLWSTLVGSRIAPVAMLETYQGTSGSTGAHEVIVGGKKLYVHTFRIGGSGLGDLFTLDRNPPTGDGSRDREQEGITAYAKQTSDMLRTLKFIKEYDKPCYLSNSPNGKFVMYGFNNDAGIEIHVTDVEKNTVRKVQAKLN